MSERSAAELVDYMARALVSNPSAIRVSERDGGRVIELETAPDDRGRVIGRQGRIAKAMRVILATSRTGAHSRLEIVD